MRQGPHAVTVDGVKRRTAAGSGRCQGGFCTQKITELLAKDLNIPLSSVTKDRPGSWIIGGNTDDDM
ncbi:MAG: (2Fe-2S)-binding protein [Papillibacter sp.]|nr:(2Fe-2S)-binding protein [Papillibacter sp.]